MVFFNDPLPCPDPAERAVKMAVEMREGGAASGKSDGAGAPRHRVGIGIAQGYATLGQIGFADRVHYTAIGTVCQPRLPPLRPGNRRPDPGLEADRRAVEGNLRLEEIGDLALKGLSQAVAVYNVAGES